MQGGAARLDGKTEFGAGIIQFQGANGQATYGFSAITQGFIGADGTPYWFSPQNSQAIQRNEFYWNVTNGQVPTATATAFIHSHPGDNGLPESNWRSGNNFSVGDLDIAKSYRQNAYLVAPNGSLKVAPYDSYDWPPTTTDVKGTKVTGGPTPEELSALAHCK